MGRLRDGDAWMSTLNLQAGELHLTQSVALFDRTLDWVRAEPPTPQVQRLIPTSPVEQALLDCPAFDHLPGSVLVGVAVATQVLEFAAGEPLIVQGQPGRGLWIVASGEVEIFLQQGDGQRKFIDLAGPGEVLGEMSLLTQQPATANAVARTAATAYLLPTADFLRLAAQYQPLYVVLSNLVATRLGREKVDVLSGKILDRYRIRGRLGAGGMSIVYDADCIEDDRRVALKMMSHRLVYDRTALEFFQREADVIESFDHPHVVRLVGRFQAFHTHFIAMEYCDGVDLKALIAERGPLPASEVRPMLGQLASALDYSHEKGIVHRDLKPSNVMLNRGGQVMLMDFGLAKPSVEAGRGTAVVMGSPRYMPFEQLQGDPIDHRADYFAFGCLAYELLRGQPLIEARSTTDLLIQHEHWSVPEVISTLGDCDAEIADMLSGALQPRAYCRHLDLPAISRWADCSA